jgi:hypothetical protein
LDDLVPSSDLANKIDVGNIERSDYENPILNTVPEIHSVQMASDGYANYFSFLYSKLPLLFLHTVFSMWLGKCIHTGKTFTFFVEKKCFWATF